MPIKLMIVDDSNIIRSKITRTLSAHNMEVVATAGNGARFCATSTPKIGPRKCFILTLR